MKDSQKIFLFAFIFGCSLGICFGIAVYETFFERKYDCKEIKEKQAIQYKIDSLQKLLK